MCMLFVGGSLQDDSVLPHHSELRQAQHTRFGSSIVGKIFSTLPPKKKLENQIKKVE